MILGLINKEKVRRKIVSREEKANMLICLGIMTKDSVKILSIIKNR